MASSAVHVITADEEKRAVLIHVRDEKGAFVFNADRTELLTEWLYGDVVLLDTANPSH